MSAGACFKNENSGRRIAELSLVSISRKKRTGFLSIESGLRDFGKSASDMIARKLSFVVNRKEK